MRNPQRFQRAQGSFVSKLVIVQSNVSQLDEPVYDETARLIGDRLHVIYWNDYGLVRTKEDPELGAVPQFGESSGWDYPRTWLGVQDHDWRAVLRSIRAQAPAAVILSDLPRSARARIALGLRLRGVRVFMRSDKNKYSPGASSGFAGWLERVLTRQIFSGLAAASPLSRDYYAWPESKPVVLFPYTTRAAKFDPGPDARAAAAARVRGALGIPDGHKTFVSAAKFAARENPWQIIHSFERVASDRDDVALIALGDGRLLPEIRAYCDDRGLGNIHFPGYVAFTVLQDYFLAADFFVHFPEVEPWGVSFQDALVAGLGVAAGQNVGSARHFLRGDLTRFLVDTTDTALCAAAMCVLVAIDDPRSHFAPARAAAEPFLTESVAASLAALVE